MSDRQLIFSGKSIWRVVIGTAVFALGVSTATITAVAQ